MKRGPSSQAELIFKFTNQVPSTVHYWNIGQPPRNVGIPWCSINSNSIRPKFIGYKSVSVIQREGPNRQLKHGDSPESKATSG